MVQRGKEAEKMHEPVPKEEEELALCDLQGGLLRVASAGLAAAALALAAAAVAVAQPAAISAAAAASLAAAALAQPARAVSLAAASVPAVSLAQPVVFIQGCPGQRPRPVRHCSLCVRVCM